jgi:hypothetical protein
MESASALIRQNQSRFGQSGNIGYSAVQSGHHQPMLCGQCKRGQPTSECPVKIAPFAIAECREIAQIAVNIDSIRGMDFLLASWRSMKGQRIDEV